MSVSTHYTYPLGSCTMSNPKRPGQLASLPGLVDLHPYQSEAGCERCSACCVRDAGMLAEIAGLPAVSLQPAAGAQGEFAALAVVASGVLPGPRREPDESCFRLDAHGTNPASARHRRLRLRAAQARPNASSMLTNCGQKSTTRPPCSTITNPTHWVCLNDIAEISRILHDAGGLVAIDGDARRHSQKRSLDRATSATRCTTTSTRNLCRFRGARRSRLRPIAVRDYWPTTCQPDRPSRRRHVRA